MSTKAKKLAKISVASLIALSLSTPTTATADSANKDYIKCYGVAAANKNDCGTPGTACAASVANPAACYAWIYTPKDICEKLANASVNAPAKDCKSPKG